MKQRGTSLINPGLVDESYMNAGALDETLINPGVVDESYINVGMLDEKLINPGLTDEGSMINPGFTG